MANVPSERSQSSKGWFHGVAVDGDATRKLGVVVGNNQNEGVDFIAARQARNGGKSLLCFPLHAGPVRYHTKS